MISAKTPSDTIARPPGQDRCRPDQTAHKISRDLGLAYSPGVVSPALKSKQSDDAYLYTSKGNLVAVVTNGTAV